MIETGTHIRWVSEGPRGSKKREGIVRAHLPPGRKIRLPKSADASKLKASEVNSVHARYLVEIPRRNARSGRPLASVWMAPKAKILDKVARKIRG